LEVSASPGQLCAKRDDKPEGARDGIEVVAYAGSNVSSLTMASPSIRQERTGSVADRRHDEGEASLPLRV
jgi:hypothetical protein